MVGGLQGVDDLVEGEEYYRLPESLAEGAEALFDRFTRQGLQVMVRDGGGGLRPATAAGHGWPSK